MAPATFLVYPMHTWGYSLLQDVASRPKLAETETRSVRSSIFHLRKLDKLLDSGMSTKLGYGNYVR